MIFVPRIRIWGKSRPKLVEALGEYYSETNYRLILNMGSDVHNTDVHTINKVISIMSDKILMNHKLDELGIYHPKTYYYPFDDLPNIHEECVLKKRHSERGNNIIFSFFDEVNKDLLGRNDYIQKFIPFEKEYRVGVDFKRVFGIREKLLNPNCNPKIKNSKSCSYETRDIPELRDLCWDIRCKFGVDLVGIDVGLYLGKYIVIELNSAPTIGKYWAKLLAKDLVDLCYEMM